MQYGGMRILSLLPSATEIVYALGLGDALVGVTDECDHPPEAVTKPVVSRSALATGRPLSAREIDEAVRGRMDGQQPLYVLDSDLLRREQPEVVLTQDLCRVCAVPSGQVQRALDQLGLPEAKVVSLDPSTLDDVIGQIDVVGQLLETGQVEHAFLGVEPAELTPQVAERFDIDTDEGVLVFSVVEGSPAAHAGLRAGDVIIAVDGEPLRAVEDLLAALRERSPGDRVALDILRRGGQRSLTVTLADRPEE
jgi:iron complex transport system substrate-binding protein